MNLLFRINPRYLIHNFFLIYLAIAENANSTFNPVLADVSIKATLYSLANLSPSSRFTSRSVQSALLPESNNL